VHRLNISAAAAHRRFMAGRVKSRMAETFGGFILVYLAYLDMAGERNREMWKGGGAVISGSMA
jgi:hypothetical protein